MEHLSKFTIVFSHKAQPYVGIVHVSLIRKKYFYTIYIDDKQFLFFVNDELDCWIENNKGNTPLALKIGESIDRHYHPDRFLNNPPLADPE